MNKILIKSLAIICSLIGVYYLFRNFNGHIWYLFDVIKGNYPGHDQELWMVVATISAFIVLIIRPVAGFGLFRLKNWGKNLTIGVLIADFLIRVIGFVHIWTYKLRNPEFKKLAEEALKSIAEAQAMGEKVYVETVSMIPSYIIAVLSLISIIILLRVRLDKLKEMRNTFCQTNNCTGRQIAGARELTV